MFPTENNPEFTLKRGTVITVPKPSMMLTHAASKPDAEGGKTPLIARLRRSSGDVFAFARPEECLPGIPGSIKSREFTRVPTKALFIPKDVRPGDKLRVEWVDGNSACALPV